MIPINDYIKNRKGEYITMARGKKKEVEEVKGVIGLVEFNPDIIEDGSKSPHVPIDKFSGICIDADNFELVCIKQTTVTEENIKSTTTKYENKFKIGDTYQEWITMGKYLNSIETAVECYIELRFKDEVSKKRYRTYGELIEIKREIKADINKFMGENAIPIVATKLSLAYGELDKITKDIVELQKLKQAAMKECDFIINVAKEKYASMVAKGLIEQKKIEHKNKEEEA